MTLLYAWMLASLLMSAVWLYYRMSGNPGVVDVAWSIGHWLTGALLLFDGGIDFRNGVIFGVLTVWAFRLAGFLFWTRVRVGDVDKRYTKLSDQWTMAPAFGFFLNFQFQAFLIIPIVLCLYFSGMAPHSSLNALDLIGLVVVGIGVIFASIADQQRLNFSKNNPGQVCDTGLWRYSRHPNYFFEWLVWVGFAITALSTPYGWIGLLSPLTLYLIMVHITGPITEKGSIESRGQAYTEYQKKTAMFFLLPTKKG